jgi:hypothetical protein
MEVIILAIVAIADHLSGEELQLYQPGYDFGP